MTLSPGIAHAAASGYTLPLVTPGPPGYFFAYDNQTTAFSFEVIAVQGGALVPTTYSNFISGFATAAMTYDRDGFVYANTGEVIDVRDPAAPHRVGTFAGGGPQLPASRSDDALRVSESPGKLDIELLDAKTFTSVSALHIASTFDQIGPLALIGTNRIAVAGSTTGFGRGVYLTRNAPDPNPAPVQVAPIAGSGVIEVPIAARALVADPVRQVLYAAVAAGAPAYENRLVTIDPKNGAIVGSVPVGSDPVAMSLSDDASTLWVSLAGASAVRRVDLTKGVPVPGPPHDLPYSVVGQDVIALPGRPDSVVVVLYSRNVAGQGFSGAVFLDDGLLRPGFPTSLGESQMVAGPPGVLFAFNGLTTGFDFFTIRYDDTSAVQTTDVSPIQGFSAELAYDPDGYLLASYGDVVDVRDPLNPTHVGKFGFNGPVLPFPGPTALMVSEGILHKLDTTAFTEVASPPIICGGTPPSRTPRDVVQAGTGRIAYIADQGPLPLYSPTVCIVEDPTLIP